MQLTHLHFSSGGQVNQIALLIACFCMAVAMASYSNEIDYSDCESIQDAIARETQEIADTDRSITYGQIFHWLILASAKHG